MQNDQTWTHTQKNKINIAKQIKHPEISKPDPEVRIAFAASLILCRHARVLLSDPADKKEK